MNKALKTAAAMALGAFLLAPAAADGLKLAQELTDFEVQNIRLFKAERQLGFLTAVAFLNNDFIVSLLESAGEQELAERMQETAGRVFEVLCEDMSPKQREYALTACNEFMPQPDV